MWKRLRETVLISFYPVALILILILILLCGFCVLGHFILLLPEAIQAMFKKQAAHVFIGLKT